MVDICYQLACGLLHLHGCGVLHRDLKTDNALVAAKDPLVVKWADFGLGVKLDTSPADCAPRPYGSIGTNGLLGSF